MSQRYAYCSPSEVWEEFDAKAGENRAPSYLQRLCETAARRIDRYCRRAFVVEHGTRYCNRPRLPDVLWLPDDLLELTSLTVGRDDAKEWTFEQDFFLEPLNTLPKTYLRAELGRSFWETQNQTKAISIAGKWGYWDDEDEVLNLPAALTAAATELESTSAATLAGMVLRIGDETLYGARAEGNTLTLERGILGTEAVAHERGVPMLRILPPPDIQEAAVALTVRAVKSVKAAFSDVSGMNVFGQGEIAFVKALPEDVKLSLSTYRRTRV